MFVIWAQMAKKSPSPTGRGISLLFPRIVVTDRTVLKLLTYDLDFLVVLLTVFPLLDVVDAVAVGALYLLHGGAIYGVHEFY